MAVTPREILDDHVIYGDWDNTYCNEVLVYNHPNGIYSHVFVMGGADYGGGIVYEGKLKSKAVEDFANSAENNDGFYSLLRSCLMELKYGVS